eukprot:1318841-Pleurochrysis_carterae.AAC.1
MYASDNAASSTFHAAVSAPSRVPTPEPVSRVALRLTPYPGRVRVFAYVLTSVPRPDRLYYRLYSSLPPSPPASERSYTEPRPDPSSLPPPPMPPSLPPSPAASEQSENEQQPSQPRVSSARVTRSQTRAREEAGIPSLLVGSTTLTPVLN